MQNCTFLKNRFNGRAVRDLRYHFGVEGSNLGEKFFFSTLFVYLSLSSFPIVADTFCDSELSLGEHASFSGTPSSSNDRCGCEAAFSIERPEFCR